MVFQNTLSIAIGGLIVWVWPRLNKKTFDLYSIPIASGFVAGESLITALIAILFALH
jgi:uncharacterized oligopeptide transporter (OPT) family protein